MSSEKKVVFESNVQHVDFTTGEVKSELTNKVVKIPQEPPYVKCYIDDLCKLNGFTKSQHDMLLALIRKIDWNNEISMTPEYRKRLAKHINCSPQTIKNNISHFIKCGLLMPIGRGEYFANPQFFARGEWRNIMEMRSSFELRIRYSETEGRIVETEKVDDQPELF